MRPRRFTGFGKQPHRIETFKLSTDPLFVEKVRDIVGPHMTPPERALVLCVDEKSQIQALDRPSLSCRRVQDKPSDAAMTTPVTARYPCSRPLTLRPER